jgi:hypothetical protein
MQELRESFESKVDIPLIRIGKKQKIETLIKEEALLLDKYIRNEKTKWIPRIALAKALSLLQEKHDNSNYN